MPVRAERVVFENSQDSAKERKKRAQKKERKKWAGMPLVLAHGLRLDVRAGQWKPLALMTNLSPCADGSQVGRYTLAQIGELYRRRWDIETLFKFLKQHLGYGHLTSRSENGIEVML